MIMDQVKNSSLWKNVSFSDTSSQEPGYVIWLKTAAYFGLFVASVIGNCFVIAAYKLNLNKKIRTVSNTFIVSMAVADLSITIGSVPERIARVLANDRWLIPGLLGVITCKLVNFIEKLSLNVSVLHLASIAIDRYLVVFYPRRKIITGSKSKRIITLIWLLSAGYCVPILVYGNILNDNGMKYCKVRKFFENWRIWYIFFLLVLFGTFVLIVFLYTAIAVKLWRKKTPGVRLSFRSRRTEKLNLRIIKMVAIIVIVCYVCFLPYWIGWIFCSYHFNEIICSSKFVFVAIFLSYLNSSLNPIIYTIFNENFRVAFRRMVKIIFCCVREDNMSVSGRAGKDGFVIGVTRLESGPATDNVIKLTKTRSLDFLGAKI